MVINYYVEVPDGLFSFLNTILSPFPFITYVPFMTIYAAFVYGFFDKMKRGVATLLSPPLQIPLLIPHSIKCL